MAEYINQSAGLLSTNDVKNDDKVLILEPAYSTTKGDRVFWNVKIKLPNGQKKLATIFDVSGDQFVKKWGKNTEDWVGHTATVTIKESKKGNLYVLFVPTDDAPVEVAAGMGVSTEYPKSESEHLPDEDGIPF